MFGGRNVYFPKDALACKWLVTAVGYEAAEKLCDHFWEHRSDTTVLIPKGNGNRAADMISDIMKMTDDGMPANEIAANLGVHVRSVFRARKRGNEMRARRLAKRIARLKERGLENHEITKELGISVASLNGILKNLHDGTY